MHPAVLAGLVFWDPVRLRPLTSPSPPPPPQVGHTFLLGQLYSETLGAFTTTESGGRVPLHMGCYGIGLSRLLAAVVEARARPGQHISWPTSIAPFKLCVVTPKVGDEYVKQCVIVSRC